MKQNCIAVVEDWNIYLEGLTLLLERYGCDVIIKANNITGLSEQLLSCNDLPDTCIINIAGLIKEEDIFREIKTRYPGMKMVAYSSNEGAPTMDEAMVKGIDCYLLRSDRLEDTLSALTTKPEPCAFNK